MRPLSVTPRLPRTRRTVASRAGRLAVPALVVVASVALAACGSDSDSDSSTGSPTTTTSASAPDSTSAVVVKTASNPDLGTILVDADGMTLYTLTNNGEAVACSGACLTAWPPLLLPAGTTTATGADGVTDLGTTAGAGGELVTHAGLPLYRFAADGATGDTTGEGISSFGGVWHVVQAGGAAPSSSSTSTSETSGSPY